MQVGGPDQGGKTQCGGVKSYAVLTFFRVLAAQSVAVMWGRVTVSEKLRKTAFGIQRTVAHLCPSHPHPKLVV